MLLLAFDTSSKAGTVALAEDGRILDERDFTVGLWHGREIMLRIKEVFEAADRKFEDLDRVVVGVGPGSYTGLRVAVATAKTLAWTLKAELAGVSTMDAVAENAPGDAEEVAVALDAKRGEVYGALYRRVSGGLERKTPCLVEAPEVFAEKLDRGTCLVGDGALLYMNTFDLPGVQVGDEESARVRASHIARLGALAEPEKNPHDLAPMYLRLSAAEEKLSGHGPKD